MTNNSKFVLPLIGKWVTNDFDFQLGAVASLCRSVTDFSIGSPHTGVQSYADGVPQIPGAALSVEDAAMLYRLYKAGKISILII